MNDPLRQEEFAAATKRSAEAIGAGLGQGAGNDWMATLLVDGPRWCVVPMGEFTGTGERDRTWLRDMVAALGGRGHRAATIRVAAERFPHTRELLMLHAAEPGRGQTWMAEIERGPERPGPAKLGPWLLVHDGGACERYLVEAVTP